MAEVRKKICYVIPEYRADTPTHFNHLYDFIREASKTVDLYLYIEKGDVPEGALGAKMIRVGNGKNPFSRWWYGIKLFYRMRSMGICFFYVHYSFGAACAAVLVRMFKGGRVYYWNCGEPWKYKRNFLREWFERRVYRSVDFVVTGAESLKKKYAEAYGISEQKIKVMPNWIDIEKFKSQISNLKVEELRKQLNIFADEKIILFAHRLSRRKGAQYLPEIIKAFKNEKVAFIIIGDGPEKQNTALRIKDLGLYDRARMLGWIPNNDMPLYYALADVFVMPSDEEGFPRVLLEAMAFGVPFAAFAVGGVREIIPPEFQEYVAQSGNVGQFTSAVRGILSLPKEKKELLMSAE
ncbi:glycosyltransferase family 4 protein, partial [Patescibacteria group bacterium]|nr:glycosyltransferase family 4 protein [Patescibacteria group bacterium]